ncbi:hypothetical protein NQ315_015185 [Exocentrus adspersus]|uniref:Uncharacterized protein n=1 Tax=Exocentrus adspersus TaxID=1586481 RepID=A0AAV8VIF0_9CUCU|nr:hypothetical protein NQ315_015185 [Exocentrus adspersus]
MTTDISIVRWDPTLQQEIVDDYEYDGGNSSSRLFERSRIKALADERESVQKKTFQKWVNSHLVRVNSRITDLYCDMRDGKNLIKLLEVLSGERLPRPTKGKMRIHCLENVDKALQFLREQRVHLENMGSHDIVDGNPRLSLDEDNWIKEKEQIVSTSDIGHDLTTVNLLLSKHKILENELAAHESQLEAALGVGEELINGGHFGAEKIQERLNEIRDAWKHLLDLAAYRRKRLEEAVDYHQLFADADDIDIWMLDTLRLVSSEDVGRDEGNAQSLLKKHKDVTEELKNYVSTIDALHQQAEALGPEVANSPEEMNANASRVAVVNQLARQLLHVEHPNSEQITARQNQLNQKWAELREKAEAKREELNSAHGVQTFHIECRETTTWIEDKIRILQTTDSLEMDLTGIMTLQRRLSGMERDLAAIQAKLTSLQKEAESIEDEHPEEAAVIRERITQIQIIWERLTQMLKERDSKLCDEGHFASDKIAKRADNIDERRLANREKAQALLERLRDQLELHQFLRDCDELGEWIQEKHITAQDETYRSAKTVHSKWTRHQAFEAEIAANKERLYNLQKAGEELAKEKPEYVSHIQPKIEEMADQFDVLEQTTKEKGERLFDANREVLIHQTCDDIDSWMNELEKQIESDDTGSDLASVNILMQKQQMIETQMAVKAVQVGELEKQTKHLETAAPEKDMQQIKSKKQKVEERFQQLKQPLLERQRVLEKKKEALQFRRDVEDELLWIAEKMPQATSTEYGNSLFQVHMLEKKTQSLQTEVDNHEPRINTVCNNGQKLIDEGHEDSVEFGRLINELHKAWQELKDAIEKRRENLLRNERAQQYLFDANEAECWMSEQELYMMVEDRGKDETSARNFMKKHESLEAAVEAYADTIRSLGETVRDLAAEGHPLAEQVAIKQSQLDKLYAGLKDLAQERRAKLDEALQLFLLNRDVGDLEQWIADREVVASSHELGQDYDHVTLFKSKEDLVKDVYALNLLNINLNNSAKVKKRLEKVGAGFKKSYRKSFPLMTSSSGPFELREMKRRQEAAEAEERARREKEEAERLAAIAASQPREAEQVMTDRPDSSSPAVEERPVHGQQPRPMTLPSSPTIKPSPPQASPRSQTQHGSIGDEDGFEGHLVRKHEWENTTTKASNRSWDKVYCVLRGTQLSFYKDSKAAKFMSILHIKCVLLKMEL